MFSSFMQERGLVQFPMGYKDESLYMLPFTRSEGLPAYAQHWQPTVDQMLAGVKCGDKTMYFMVDRKFVMEGVPHRRPGVHVDGYWIPDLLAHGYGSHRGRGGGHSGTGRHRGYGGHGGRHMSGSWSDPDFSEPEALILASDMSAARAYVGEFDGPIGEGGDCSSISLEGLTPVPMMAHRVYAGTVSTLHESLPVPVSGWRTVVRLNCPGVTMQ